MTVYYIKSVKWTKHKPTNPLGEDIWWGPNNSGYTKDITQAGIYTEKQVINHRKHHRPDVSEIVPIDVEPWSDEIIQMNKIHLSKQKELIEHWNQKLDEAQQLVKHAKENVNSYQESVKQLNMELEIQEMLKNN
ncbi:hypothetical protein [Bacillus thuringiensis]|uniref:hypothetical protein n=1 Tax=Bacillus thuringiensis TaxID=1428 RepID=UPI0021D683AA|nr:hypothetical protein [Bacillus thuringiensis]MCU7667301.1 hypothetical protein [Bacillus thuringiensis]